MRRIALRQYIYRCHQYNKFSKACAGGTDRDQGVEYVKKKIPHPNSKQSRSNNKFTDMVSNKTSDKKILKISPQVACFPRSE